MTLQWWFSDIIWLNFPLIAAFWKSKKNSLRFRGNFVVKWILRDFRASMHRRAYPGSNEYRSPSNTYPVLISDRAPFILGKVFDAWQNSLFRRILTCSTRIHAETTGVESALKQPIRKDFFLTWRCNRSLQEQRYPKLSRNSKKKTPKKEDGGSLSKRWRARKWWQIGDEIKA